MEEILPKLEAAVLTDTFYKSIARDVKDYYKDRPGDLSVKSMWVCCFEAFSNTLTKDMDIAQELFCGKNQVLSNLVSSTCTPDDILKAMVALYGDIDIPRKKWDQLNLIFQTAVQEGLIERNPVSLLMPVIKSKSKDRLYLLNALFRKCCFTDAEELRMIRFLREEIPVPRKKNSYAPRYVVESKWLAAAFSWFEGIQLREICPLLWGDLCKIEDDLDEMYACITKHLDAHGNVISNVNYKNKKKFRKVALAMVLLEMLLERKKYLKSRYGYTDELLEEMPIMLEEEPTGKSVKSKVRMLTQTTAAKVKKQLLNEARLSDDIISLLDGDRRITVNFTDLRYDLFLANFSHKAYQCCGFTEGELCYHLGNKGPDTYSNHYCDYGEDYIQYNMVRKLYRWTGNFDRTRVKRQPVYVRAVLESEMEIDAPRFAGGRTSASVDLSPTGEAEGSVLVEIESVHGLDGAAVLYGKGETDG